MINKYLTNINQLGSTISKIQNKIILYTYITENDLKTDKDIYLPALPSLDSALN